MRTLASSTDDVFPLCHDYAKALQRIQTFAQRLTQSQFTLQLKSSEELDGVTVKSLDGSSRKLETNQYSYDRAAARLTIQPGVMQPSDTGLDLDIADNCVEIPR